MSAKRVVVLGNCQSRPLASMLARTSLDIEITATIVVHLTDDSHEGQYQEALADADVILSQRVADNYPCKFVRTSELQSKYGCRVISWPNLYWRGYNPELTYLRRPNGQTVKGPLGDYHIETVRNAWEEGHSVDASVALLGDIDFNRSMYSEVPLLSLDSLEQREQECDVHISDVIRELMWTRRLFHTFNHPTSHLLSHLATVIVRRCFDARTRVQGGDSEPLGKYRVPINPWIKSEFAGRIEDSTFMGDRFESQAGVPRLVSGTALYSTSQIVEAFYRLYDLQRLSESAP